MSRETLLSPPAKAASKCQPTPRKKNGDNFALDTVVLDVCGSTSFLRTAWRPLEAVPCVRHVIENSLYMALTLCHLMGLFIAVRKKYVIILSSTVVNEPTNFRHGSNGEVEACSTETF